MSDNIIEVVNVSVVSNVTIEPFFSKKIKILFQNSYDIVVNNIIFEDYKNKAQILKTSDVILIWINIDILFPNMYIRSISGSVTYDTAVQSIINLYHEVTDFICDSGCGKILIMSQENNNDKTSIFKGNIISHMDIVRLINNKIIEEFSPRFTILDMDKLMINIGMENIYDEINKYRWNGIYSNILIESVATELYKQFQV